MTAPKRLPVIEKLLYDYLSDVPLPCSEDSIWAGADDKGTYLQYESHPRRFDPGGDYTSHLSINIFSNEPHICYLVAIGIAKEYRGRGLGRRLYLLTEEIALCFGCRCVRQTPSGTTFRGEFRGDYLTRTLGYRPVNADPDDVEYEKELPPMNKTYLDWMKSYPAMMESRRALCENWQKREKLFQELLAGLAHQLLLSVAAAIEARRPNCKCHIYCLGQNVERWGRFPVPRSKPPESRRDTYKGPEWLAFRKPVRAHFVLTWELAAFAKRDKHFIADDHGELLFVRLSGECVRLPPTEDELFELLSIPVLPPDPGGANEKSDRETTASSVADSCDAVAAKHPEAVDAEDADAGSTDRDRGA